MRLVGSRRRVKELGGKGRATLKGEGLISFSGGCFHAYVIRSEWEDHLVPRSLSDLEQRRELIAQRIAKLGDLRPGSITGTSGRCGKPECHCHQPGQPGHGPHFRLTYKVAGKTISEALPTPAAIQKAAREVEEFRKFQQLTREFLGTNTEICRLRPLEEEPETELEKKRLKRSVKRSRAK